MQNAIGSKNKSFSCLYERNFMQSYTTGLSLRGRGWGFPLATMNVAPGYFQRKIEAKKKTLAA